MPKSFLPRKTLKTGSSSNESDQEMNDGEDLGEDGDAQEPSECAPLVISEGGVSETEPESLSIEVQRDTFTCNPKEGESATSSVSSAEVGKKVGELMDHLYMSNDKDQEKNAPLTKPKMKIEKNKVFTCVFCCKTFPHQYTLNRHLPVHTNDRKYGCNICGKTFRQASTLCRHKVVHTDEKKFQCKICYKTFNRVSTLIAHEKIHTDEKAYICTICGKGFHQKGNLKNHVYTHTGERPFVCDIPSCSKSFNQLSNLSVHMIMKHKGQKCPLCKLRFKSQEELATHEASKHIIMHVSPIGLEETGTGAGSGGTEESEENDPVDCIQEALGQSVPVNIRQSRTITFPNGDKTIIPKNRGIFHDQHTCNSFEDMDPSVKAAASILLQLESSSGHDQRQQAQIEIEKLLKPPSQAEEGKEPAADSKSVTVEGKIELIDVLAPVLKPGLHQIGTTVDGQVMAVYTKNDGSCSLVKVIQNSSSQPSADSVVIVNDHDRSGPPASSKEQNNSHNQHILQDSDNSEQQVVKKETDLNILNAASNCKSEDPTNQ